MDLGNKKGPVGRWDFDTPEEYSEYMSTREALPKAAFQYGKDFPSVPDPDSGSRGLKKRSKMLHNHDII